MTASGDLEVIESEARRLLAFARRDPVRRVPQYPAWTLRDLVAHTASVHARTALLCRTLPAERLDALPPPEGRDVFEWYESTLAEMVGALASSDLDAPVWTMVPDRSLRAWQRRMVIETGVHRWDAQEAVETPEPLRDEVAARGLDEFADQWLPRLGPVPGLTVTATDLGRSWTFGDQPPVDEVAGAASSLYLRLLARPGSRLPAAWEAAVDGLPSAADQRPAGTARARAPDPTTDPAWIPRGSRVPQADG